MDSYLKNKGFLLTLLTSAIMLSISIALQYKKTWFVHETGNIKLFGGVGDILAIALLFRWKHARLILRFLVLLVACMLILVLTVTDRQFITAYLLLLTILGLVYWLLTYSKDVKQYLDGEGNNPTPSAGVR